MLLVGNFQKIHFMQEQKRYLYKEDNLENHFYKITTYDVQINNEIKAQSIEYEICGILISKNSNFWWSSDCNSILGLNDYSQFITIKLNEGFTEVFENELNQNNQIFVKNVGIIKELEGYNWMCRKYSPIFKKVINYNFHGDLVKTTEHIVKLENSSIDILTKLENSLLNYYTEEIVKLRGEIAWTTKEVENFHLPLVSNFHELSSIINPISIDIEYYENQIFTTIYYSDTWHSGYFTVVYLNENFEIKEVSYS
jgi:hypothetical protein